MTLGSDNTEPGAAALSAETTGETPPSQLPAADPAPRAAGSPGGTSTPGRISRIREWFTRTQALREARARAPVARPELLLGAFSSVDLAEDCLHGRRGRAADGALASDAGRRAVLLALASQAGRERDAAEPLDAASLFDTAPRELLERAASDAGVDRLREEVVGKDFRSYAEIAPEEQRATALRLIAFARALATSLEEPQHVVDRFVRQRFVRSGSVALLFLVALLLVSSDALISFRDLAAGKPWRASSTYGNGGCRSPAQTCSESPFFFFHTVDEDKPWVEIDLGKNLEFSELLVLNRSDCCGDRAVPLVVEVSTKRSRWKTVARIDTDFHEWRPSFKPVEARYVRLKATRKTLLHLERVRVLP